MLAWPCLSSATSALPCAKHIRQKMIQGQTSVRQNGSDAGQVQGEGSRSSRDPRMETRKHLTWPAPTLRPCPPDNSAVTFPPQTASMWSKGVNISPRKSPFRRDSLGSTENQEGDLSTPAFLEGLCNLSTRGLWDGSRIFVRPGTGALGRLRFSRRYLYFLIKVRSELRLSQGPQLPAPLTSVSIRIYKS